MRYRTTARAGRSANTSALREAGYSCREEPDEYGHWVIFDGLESTLNFSVEDGAAVFATFEMSLADPDEAIEGIRRVLAEAGWDAEPGESE